jgi:cellulose biosynthesis protein BcsQ
MKKIALFNHKGGVGKTTITVNIADALRQQGKSVLLVDADPQCNLTSFYLPEATLEELLEKSGDHGEGETLWSAVKPVAQGRGGIAEIPEIELKDGLYLLPGDVLLSEYEEVLPLAWTECFARMTRGYDITSALSKVVDRAAQRAGVDVCLYDVGPNVGALNRAIILDCDAFITPVAADLFSLRALSTVGRSIAKWISDWQAVRTMASVPDRRTLFVGKPMYLGYITSAFKVNAGRNAANPHAQWEAMIAPRVRDRIAKDLAAIDPKLIPHGGNKIGGIKNFHSLAPDAQRLGMSIRELQGEVNPGHNNQIREVASEFEQAAREIVRRAGI